MCVSFTGRSSGTATAWHPTSRPTISGLTVFPRYSNFRPLLGVPTALQEPHVTGQHAATAAVSTGPLQPGRRSLLLGGCTCCAGALLLPSWPQGASASQAAAATPAPAVWSYDGPEGGTSAWGGVCSAGSSQSPIDLPRSLPSPGGACIEPPAPAYGPARAHVLNTGVTAQVTLDEPEANTLMWRGRLLQLLQFHFHTPSEHALDGVRCAAEAHLVHRDVDTGACAPQTSLAAFLSHSAAQQALASCCDRVFTLLLLLHVGNVTPADALPAVSSILCASCTTSAAAQRSAALVLPTLTPPTASPLPLPTTGHRRHHGAGCAAGAATATWRTGAGTQSLSGGGTAGSAVGAWRRGAVAWPRQPILAAATGWPCTPALCVIQRQSDDTPLQRAGQLAGLDDTTRGACRASASAHAPGRWRDDVRPQRSSASDAARAAAAHWLQLMSQSVRTI
jgi:Eukaryotic-type carbonic anhydrase